ncbi:MAG: hypothetical protein QOF46_377, partial [Paraburkholderia sp.]|nr:hypothetical protein [Paraburkholderia sp.]
MRHRRTAGSATCGANAGTRAKNESQNVSESDTGYVDEIAYTFGYCDELNPL